MDKRYQVVRIDNGLNQPHTGVVAEFDTLEKAKVYARTKQIRNPVGASTWAHHPWAILDTETGEKRDAREA